MPKKPEPYSERYDRVISIITETGARCTMQHTDRQLIWEHWILRDGRMVIVQGTPHGVEVYSNESTPNTMPELIDWLTKEHTHET